MNRLLKSFLLLLCLVSNGYAAEDEKWYQIELIIFARTHDANFAEEQWSYTENVLANDGKQLASPELTTANPAKKTLVAFQRQSTETLTLNSLKQKLDDKDHFTVLVHTGWKQPLKSGGDVTPAKIDSREIAEENYNIANSLPPELSEIAKPIDLPNPADLPLVSGVVALKLSRYLHFSFDLYYKPNNESKFIPWSDSRKIKLNELNYYDHPLLGIVARVSPVKN